MRPTTCATEPTPDPDQPCDSDARPDSGADPGPDRGPDVARRVVEVEIDSGPGCAEVTGLCPGRHVVGRAASAAVRVDDPEVEPHHLLVDVTADGRVAVFHLTGRLPVLADHEPVVGWVELGAGSVIDLGATRLRMTLPSPPPEPPHTGEVPGDPWQRMLVRTPRAVPFLALSGVEPPAVTGLGPSVAVPGGMLVGAATGLVGGLVMAWVTGSAVAALFGVVAGVAAAATWTVAHVRRLRERRRRHRADEAARAEFEAAVAASADRIRDHHLSTVVSASRRLTAPDDHELWSRRGEHGDAFTVTLGRGDLDRPVPVAAGSPGVSPDASSPLVGDPDVLAVVERHRTLRDVQVPAALDGSDHEVVAVEGAHAASVVRSLVLQLAVTTGPADWCLRAVLRDRRPWGWLGGLPHAAVADGRSGVADAEDPVAVSELVVGLDDGDHRRVVIVCDAPALLATRTGPLRRSLDGDRPVTILLVVTDGSGLPAVCSSALRLGSGGRGGDRWVPDLHDNAAVTAWAGLRVHASGVSVAVAQRTAARLARFVDPEDPSTAAGRVPPAVRLDELASVPQTDAEVIAAWRTGGRDPDLAAAIGASADGVIEVDLVRDGPHGLVAGTTGSGKSELLRTLVVSLAARVSPEHLSFVLIDYKGGATFDACARLPHTVAVVTDLDAGLAERALVGLDAELHRRERLLRAHGAADLTEYRAIEHTPPLARMVVVIDEFAALATELPDFLAALVGVAQRGRSLGIHLLLATQRPAGVVDDAIRANTNLRIALRLHDVSDAVDVVGDAAPAGFARGLPGRSMLRLGPGEVVEFQAATCTTPRAHDGSTGTGPADRRHREATGTDLAALVSTIESAARSVGASAPHRPWLPPLDEVTVDDLEAGAVGVVDDPVGQCRRPLGWSTGGNLALVGALGSGTTTTLAALARTIAARSDATLQVIDARGDTALDPLADLPECAGVVRLHEQERLGRLLRRLERSIDDRRAGSTIDVDHTEVLLVDGLAAVRRALDEPGFADEAAALDRVLAEGPAIGVVTAAVVEADCGMTTLARFADRWVFHLDDTAAGATLGVPAARVPGPVPGRLVIASSGLVAQVVPPPVSATSPPAIGSGPPAPLLPELPRHVTARDLRTAGPGAAASAVAGPIAVGLRFDDLGLATLDVGAGDRLAIVGPPGSGRSGVLVHLVDEWRGRHPDHDVAVLVGSERSPLAQSPWRCELGEWGHTDQLGVGHGPTHRLIVVDDAERLDDEDGRLAELVGARRSSSTTVMIAGRADALRSGFDHWTAPIRRTRLGIVMAASSELDADVLGVVPPRRCPIPARPGLGWLIQHGTSTLAQLVTGVE